MTNTRAFHPDWTSAPGETIADILEERHMSEAEFAQGIGKPEERIRDLLIGRGTITEEMARKLESAIGGSTAFWMARERHYREGLHNLALRAKESSALKWLEELPIKDMLAFRWVPRVETSSDKVAACLQFFGVHTVSAWWDAYEAVLETAAFRTSRTFESKPGTVAAWLRRGEIESAGVACKPWNPVRFRQALHQIRALTREKDPNVFFPELQRLFAECGVAAVILRAPSGCRASGATRFLTPSKALILLSFRYLSDDQFWFSMFHEAAHLILHENTAIFLDGPNMPHNKEEEEANQFAADVLVPLRHKSHMLKLPVNGRAVMRFAREIGVSPGIVVGQLQHLGHLEYRQLNNLKQRYKWSIE